MEMPKTTIDKAILEAFAGWNGPLQWRHHVFDYEYLGIAVDLGDKRRNAVRVKIDDFPGCLPEAARKLREWADTQVH